MKRLNDRAFFLYGVIVGLSIREAIVRVIPNIMMGVEPWKARLEALRLIIYLLTITCFYFGAGVFFDRAYINEETCEKYKKRNFGLDFGCGLAHFLIFYVWSLTIVDHSRSRWDMSPFVLLMGAILLYDLLWVLATFRYDTLGLIKLWTATSTFTALLAAGTFFLTRAIWNDIIGEWSACIVVGIYILLDIVELISGQPFFEELIRRLLP
jgi:hypothetical protein